MSNDDAKTPDFESVKVRLAEIAEAVSDEALPLDDALDLYEEAVALGLQASDLLETGITVPDQELDEGAGDGAADESSDRSGESIQVANPASE